MPSQRQANGVSATVAIIRCNRHPVLSLTGGSYRFTWGAPRWVACGTSFPAGVLMLNMKRRWIWGFWGTLIVMGVFLERHSQWLVEFMSSPPQVRGNHVTLGSEEHLQSTPHHRFRGGRPTRLGQSYSNRAGNHTVPHRRTSRTVWLRVCTFSRESWCE
jgi:hypothetical protein